MSKGPGESHREIRNAVRQTRLAAALRENLRRRKAQAKRRTAAFDVNDNNAAATEAPASSSRAAKGKTD